MTLGLGFEVADVGEDCTWEAVHRNACSCPGPLGLKLRRDASWLVDDLTSAIVPRLGTVVLTSADAATLGHHAAATSEPFCLRHDLGASFRMFASPTARGFAALA